MELALSPLPRAVCPHRPWGHQGREHSTLPIPSHPILFPTAGGRHTHKPGLFEDGYHRGWLAPGDNIRSQWGAVSLNGRILPLPLAAAMPGPSVQPPPPLHALKARQPFPGQCTSPRERSEALPHQGGGERGYVHAVFFLLLQC